MEGIIETSDEGIAEAKTGTAMAIATSQDTEGFQGADDLLDDDALLGLDPILAALFRGEGLSSSPFMRCRAPRVPVPDALVAAIGQEMRVRMW